jgi:ABC-2 type transport system ATP-binding protein
VCDYLVVLVASRVRLAGDVDDLLADHHLLTGARRDAQSLRADQEVITESSTDRQSTFLIRSESPVLDPAWTVEPVGLEDLVLGYMREGGADARPRREALLRVQR